MRARLAILLALAAALLAALPALAAAARVSATAGQVTATLVSTGTRFHPGTTTLTVTRAGATTTFPGLQGTSGYILTSSIPPVIRDLDGDGEPEVLAELYSGGAHCCTRSVIARWDPAAATYRADVRDWGDATWRLTDLDRDGVPELVSWDGRWAYWGGSYAGGAFPLQVWSFRGGTLVDVTRAFPAALRRDQGRHLIGFRQLRRNGDTGKGPLAAYVADAYGLGTQDAAWRRIYRLYRLRDRVTFFHALRAQLVRLGYAPSGQPVPPITRVPAEVPVVGCAGPSGTTARVRPGRCVLRDAFRAGARAVPLSGLAWVAWGGDAAGARGPAGLRVRLSGLVRGCDVRLWYGVARITGAGPERIVHLPTCPGRR